MATPATVNPFNHYVGLDGLPLENGYIWFGEPFQDPEIVPLAAYWDDANTQPAVQPIRTTAGYPARNGAPAMVFVGAQYSMRVRDRNGRQVFYAPNVTAVDLGGGGLDVITASGGQTIVTLVNAAYTPGANALDVYLNGIRLVSGQDYFETGTNQITMAAALSAGDQVIAFARSTFGLTQAVLSDWQAQVFNGAGGGSQNFVLTRSPGAIANLDVSVTIGGIGSTLRPLIDYTLSGNTVTITPAPAVGTNNVLIRYGRSLPQDALRGDLASTASAADGTGLIGWLRAATGAVASTLYAWLDWQNVHVFEFMTLAQRIDWKARTATLDCTAAIQAANDHVALQGGGKLKYATGVGRISATLNFSSYVHHEGQYGETNVGGGTAESGTKLLWAGAATDVMVSFFNARMFGFRGFCLDGAGAAGIVGILLDGTNAPSGSQNEFSQFNIRNCFLGVQWGTSGIAGGSYANDGTRFSTFTIWSSVAGSWGFRVNSGNAGQMSVIESGGIQCEEGGIDLVVSNILQIRRVFGGGVMDTGFIRASVAIDTLIEGSSSECWGTGRTWRTNRPKFLKVVAPGEAYPMIESTITMSNNQINNPIEVGYQARITSTGDAWGQCKDYTTAIDEPAKGNFIAAPAWSAVTSYVKNKSAVNVGGVNYQCVLNHTNQTPPNATYWRVAPSYVVAINNGVDPGSIDLVTNEPTMGWIDSAYVNLSNVDPGRGWVRPAYNAAYFTTNGAGGWQVGSGDVEYYGYTLLDRTMTVAFRIVTSSITAAVGNELRISIPNGKVASQPMLNPVVLVDGGVFANGKASVDAGSTYITIKRLNEAAFTAAVNTSEVKGQITFMVD